MLRNAAPVACAIAAVALLAAATADACSCMPYRTQAEADRAGDRIWQDAALIVEATVGDVSATYERLCPARGGKPAAGDIGRTASGDRPFAIHRVFKGKAPATPVLAGEQATVFAEGCGNMLGTCDVNIAPHSRTILVLQQLPDGRFRMNDYCSLMPLLYSTRGRALFGAQ